MARLRHKSGAVVVVPDEKVDNLVRNGFTPAEQKKATSKAPRKAASSKSEK